MPTIYGRELLINNLHNLSNHLRKGIEGELTVLNYLEQLMPLDSIIIAKPSIGNLEPDFIVILPQEAFFIVEVKNFSIYGIKEILSNGVFKLKNDGITNPLSQVSSHVEQLNQFISANYHQDVYRAIGKIVVFPKISKDTFYQTFRETFTQWTPEQVQKFGQYHAFSEDLTTNFVSTLRKARKFPNAPMPMSGVHLLDLASMIQPRPITESSIEFLHKEQLIDETYFNNILLPIIQKDEKNGLRMKNSIEKLFTKYLSYLQAANTEQQVYLALNTLKAAIKAESSMYFNYINELTTVENKMLNQRTRIAEQFKSDVQQGIHHFFQKQLKIMQEEIQKITKWHTSLQDSSKKITAKIYNPLLKFAKQSDFFKEKVDDLKELDDHSELEKTLQKHVSAKYVENSYNKVLQEAINRYTESWKKVILQSTPNLRGLEAFSTSFIVESQTLKHQFGASEQVLGVTIGSAVIGTIGLAAGWHTFAYAAMNVFPPIALFAAFATVTTAILKKDSEIQKRKNQLKDAIQHYEEHLFQQIDPPRLKSSTPSLFYKIETVSDEIVKVTISEWEKRLLGQLEINDYQKMNKALLEYAELLEESLKDIEKRMK